MTRPEAAADRIRALRRRLRQSVYVLVVSSVTSFSAAGLSMVYANRVAQDSERQWCGVVVTLDEAYRATPPQSPAGRQIAADIARLRAEFNCPPRR